VHDEGGAPGRHAAITNLPGMTTETITERWILESCGFI